MCKQTRGKGPFACRARIGPVDHMAPRWAAPFTELTTDNILSLLQFLKGKNEFAVRDFFIGLASMESRFRLARNLSSLLRLLAERDIEDVLSNGFSAAENAMLIRLEGRGIPLDGLGVAHALLNVRERQELVVHFGHEFIKARDDVVKYAE